MTKISKYRFFNSCFPKVYLPALFVLLILISAPDSAKSQDNLTHYKFRVGFFTGPVSYIGDYNPWIFGSPYHFSEDLTPPSNKRTGKVDFGMWTKAMLKPYLYLRGNAHFGSLTYSWNHDDFDYLINSSYSSVGLLLETVAFPGSTLQPYISSGIKSFNYEVPPPISQSPINQYTVSEFGKSKSTLMVPVNIGINYQVSHLSNFFLEASLSLSNTDDIDNLSLPSSKTDMRYQNDAIYSLRFGVGISLIDVLNLKTPEREIHSTRSYHYPIDRIADLPRLAFSMPADTLIPRDSIEAAKSRLDETQLVANEQQEQEEIIEVIDPKNRNFDISKELEMIKEMRQEMEKQSEADDIDNREEIRNRVPRIDVKEDRIGISEVENEVVTKDPPEGYYIQVYASVGPDPAQRARKITMREVGHMLEKPQDQIIITKRRKYYEVQIGVFDSYDNTIRVLEEVKDTFNDAFTLMYVKE